MSPGLDSLRRRVDRIDAALIRLLNRRTRLSVAIGQVKKAQSRGGDANAGRFSVYAPDRERKLLDRILRGHKGPLPAESVQAIYREILSASRSLQQQQRIAYLGPEATFTHEAALKNFGRSAAYVSSLSIADVFDAVEKRRAEYGVVPIENSTEGIVNHTLDRLIESDLKICAEIVLEVSLHLLAHTGDLHRIRAVYSHPQAIPQARQWLRKHLPHAELLEAASTAQAAEIARRIPDAAAIASELAGSLYGLRLAARNIQDTSANYTRFYVLGWAPPQRPSGRDKTSIMFSVADRVGALHEALEPFREGRINLTKIESRPSKRRAWEYYFFVDFDGHLTQPRVRDALRRLRQRCKIVRVLGSYPRAADPR